MYYLFILLHPSVFVEMGDSLICSMLLVTQSGLNVYEHFVGESQLNSSQLISGMYTAFFTFFEQEMDKGSVRSIELSRTKIIVFTHLNLNAIVEFERYCEESAISILTDKVKEIISKTLPNEHYNPNKYIKEIEDADFDQIFRTSWQQEHLRNNQIRNLLDYVGIRLLDEEILPQHIEQSYETSIQIGVDLSYIITCYLKHKNIILSHIRLITEFLAIIQPTKRLDRAYFLPYYQEIEDGANLEHVLVSYSWVLPEIIETLILKQKLVIVGDDAITLGINNILESLDLKGIFKISPYYSELPPNFSEYAIIRVEKEFKTSLPLVNLYTKQYRNLVKNGYTRKQLGDRVKTDDVVQTMQELMVDLERYHKKLFDITFQTSKDYASKQLGHLQKEIDSQFWHLILQYFSIKTPFLTDQLSQTTSLKQSYGLDAARWFEGGDISSDKNSVDQPILWGKLFRSIGSYLLAPIIVIAIFYLIFSLF